jgi:hypothetical protein
MKCPFRGVGVATQRGGLDEPVRDKADVHGCATDVDDLSRGGMEMYFEEYISNTLQL